MEINSVLTCFNSKRDKFGNCYYAFRFHDCQTGSTVEGKVGNCGESNVYAVRRIWNPEIDDWDRTMEFRTEELPIRKFDKMIKDWEYAGTQPEEIAQFIRDRLTAPDPFADYVAKGGNECPFCRCGGNLHVGDMTGPTDEGQIFVNVKCLDCDKEWTDEFTLSGITNGE